MSEWFADMTVYYVEPYVYTFLMCAIEQRASEFRVVRNNCSNSAYIFLIYLYNVKLIL